MDAFIKHIIQFTIMDSHELAELDNLRHILKNQQHIFTVNIGTGYLLSMMLVINPTAKYLIFDSGEHRSAKQRMEYLKQSYPETQFEIIYGNISQSIQQYIHQKQKLHFIDLCYLNNCQLIKDEFRTITRMCQNNATLIVNNMDLTQTYSLIETEINNGKITKLIDDQLQPLATQFIGKLHHRDSVNYISKIIYVNLDRRVDRKESILKSFRNMNINPNQIERYPAVVGNPGYFGCCRSHREALILARNRGYQNVLMLEDDFVFDVTRNELDYFLEYLFVDFNESWDVVMFVYHLIKSAPYKDDKVLGRAVTATTGAGYLVNGTYLPTLIKNFEEAWPKLCNTNHHWLYVCDQSWAVLQQTDRWFYFKRPLGKCINNASDGGYH